MNKPVDLMGDLKQAQELHPVVNVMYGHVTSIVSLLEHLTDTMPTGSGIQVRIFAAKMLADLAKGIVDEVRELPEFQKLYPNYDA